MSIYPLMSRRAGVASEMASTPVGPFRDEASSGVCPASNHEIFTMTDWPLRSYLELGALPGAIACARLHARNVLMEWGLHDLCDDTEVIVSELMTNALNASVVLPEVPPIALGLLANGQSLVIQAWDKSPLTVEQYAADSESEHGRGLVVVAALSNQWGVERTGYNRKVVWCELDLPPKYLA
jgi:anti-sigma regulatory factor (Ser/Thr protein kinase)